MQAQGVIVSLEDEAVVTKAKHTEYAGKLQTQIAQLQSDQENLQKEFAKITNQTIFSPLSNVQHGCSLNLGMELIFAWRARRKQYCYPKKEAVGLKTSMYCYRYNQGWKKEDDNFCDMENVIFDFSKCAMAWPPVPQKGL